MDEPTAALSGHEVERLFGVVAHAARSTAPRCCSSRTASTRSSRSATAVTVLRDGAGLARRPLDRLTTDDLVRRMVGRELDALYPKQDADDRRRGRSQVRRG